MKNFIVFVLLTTSVFAQWLDETSVLSVPASTKMQSFTHSNGIHLVYITDGGLKYSLSKPDAQLLQSNKTIRSTGSGVIKAQVTAKDNNVYIVYVMSGSLYIAKSTDLGNSWDNNALPAHTLSNSNCTDLIISLCENKIYIAWSEYNNVSQTYFIRYNSSNNIWSNYFPVSNQVTDGGLPSLVVNNDRAYVTFSSQVSGNNEREFIINTQTWTQTESIGYPNLENEDIMGRWISYGKLGIRGSELFYMVKMDWTGWSNEGALYYYVTRNLSGGSWTWTFCFNSARNKETASILDENGTCHLIYWDINIPGYYYRSLINSTWSSEINFAFRYPSHSLNSNVNDLYLLTNESSSTSEYIYMQRYDVAPSVPKNFVGSIYSTGINAHPKMDWLLNEESDVKYAPMAYSISRKVNSKFFQLDYASGSTSSYIDFTINYAGSGDQIVSYKLQAVDMNYNYSDFTNTLEIRYGYAWKKGSGIVREFALKQNYPNPFNPSTTINYSIPEEGLVQINVYDILGNEIQKLVNEFQPSGNYEVSFHGNGLVSGVYIFRIAVLAKDKIIFSETKQMQLIK